MSNLFVFLGSVSGGLAVVLGAFGAHALRDRLGPQMLAVFETGVRYQLFHALAMLAVALLSERGRSASLLASSGALFLVGTFLFSGSLYVLTMTGVRWVGAITPIGGICFLGGWVLLALAAIRAS
jgi:uncharacterized membrane protein YgdD (TMEM256/DUF423 family)